MASILSHAARYHEAVPYTDIRVRYARTGPARPGGDYVLYWMQAYRRLESNHALDEALRRADEAGKPLVVYEGLRLDYPWASVRHHRFILEGMQANREAIMETVKWWMNRFAFGRYPLQEKLALFWHGHFCTSAKDERSASLMWNQNELLRRNCAGNFRQLKSFQC
jgi:uncharacterized protein (DUF1800 family)